MMFYSHKSTKYLRHSLEIVANAGYYLTIFIDKSFIFLYLAVNSHRRYDKCALWCRTARTGCGCCKLKAIELAG